MWPRLVSVVPFTWTLRPFQSKDKNRIETSAIVHCWPHTNHTVSQKCNSSMQTKSKKLSTKTSSTICWTCYWLNACCNTCVCIQIDGWHHKNWCGSQFHQKLTSFGESGTTGKSKTWTVHDFILRNRKGDLPFAFAGVFSIHFDHTPATVWQSWVACWQWHWQNNSSRHIVEQVISNKQLMHRAALESKWWATISKSAVN